MTAPTRTELAGLPADRRMEMLDLERQEQERRLQRRERKRQVKYQWITGFGVLFGVVFTAGGLIATALTWRTTQETQITDRYTKAVEQLGSSKREVRTAAVYALERISKDSGRDRLTTRDVLAAFIREHDPGPAVKADDLPGEPDTDVTAAFTVLARRPPEPDDAPPLDLHAIRTPYISLPDRTNLRRADLREAYLVDVDLIHADLRGADLVDADLDKADLTRADLRDADLSGSDLSNTQLFHTDMDNANLKDADLFRTNLRAADLHGTDLSNTDARGADLSNADLSSAYAGGADLSGANLRDANLRGTDLSNADVRGADLSNADLRGADLSGTDLRRISGWAKEEISKVAKTDDDTRF